MDTKPGAAPGPPPAEGVRAPREPLLTAPILLLIACGALGWTVEGVIQPAIPLLVLDQGGDAVLVGLTAAMFALPTLALRPLVGHRIDRTGHGPIHRLGGALIVVIPLVYTLASLVLVPFVRFLNGIGWAMYGTANNVVLARLAPAPRRAEAAAYLNVAYAVGFLVGPPVGLLLYTDVSSAAPFFAASLVGVAAFLAAVALARATRDRGAEGPMTSAPRPSPAVAGTPAPSAEPRGRLSRPLGRLFEPSAVAPMVGLALFMASQALFLPFAPVYARESGIDVGRLALYYPTYSILLIVGQLITGRWSDRLGRARAIGIGTVLGVTGTAVAMLGGGLLSFTVGGGLLAVGTSFVTPSFSAATMDRAPAGRTGVAMATFSMGFQLAAGLGGALWGVIIGVAGYPWPFAVAIVLQLLSLSIALRSFRAPRPTAPEPVRPAP